MDTRERILRTLEAMPDKELEEISQAINEQAMRLFLAWLLVRSLDNKEETQ